MMWNYKKNKQTPPMPAVKPAVDETKRFKHKDGTIYVLKGYVGLPFQGNNYILVAYSPEDKNREHEVYFVNQSQFCESFKEIKVSYEYQWLIRSKEDNTYYSTLAFYGRYEIENEVLEQFAKWAKGSDFEDSEKYELIKIEETKKLNKGN